MAENIENQNVKAVKASGIFALQCDESTDYKNMTQLLVFIRYLDVTSTEEDLLLCKTLPINTTGFN